MDKKYVIKAIRFKKDELSLIEKYISDNKPQISNFSQLAKIAISKLLGKKNGNRE